MSFMSISITSQELQRRFAGTKKRWFRTQYPNHKFIVEELDNPNSIHAFNRFEEQGCIEQHHCHFRLVDLRLENLYVRLGKCLSQLPAVGNNRKQVTQ